METLGTMFTYKTVAVLLGLVFVFAIARVIRGKLPPAPDKPKTGGQVTEEEPSGPRAEQ